jgi:bacillolysin
MMRREFPSLTACLVAALGLAACASPDDPAAPATRARTLAEARAHALPYVDRITYARDGAPQSVRGRLGTVDPTRLTSLGDAATALAAPLAPIASLFGVPADDLVAISSEHDTLGMTHVRYAQRKAGLDVVGGDLVVHVGADGTVQAVNGTVRDRLDLDAAPTVVAADAAAIARRTTDAAAVEVSEPRLTYVITTDDALYLAWEVWATASEPTIVDRVFVDAHGAGVVERLTQVQPARARDVYDAQQKSPPFFGDPGPHIGSEGMPPSDAVGKAAYDNTGLTYDCYKTLYNRDSYDDKGAGLKSAIHVTFQTPSGGTTKNNAAWIGIPFLPSYMVYGDGDGTFMGPTAQGFDVTAHELTHAVTGATAKLAYQNESGALNEAMSDIMSSRCEAWRDGAVSDNTWKVGEEIFTPAKPDDALRYMNNPTLDKDLYPANLGGSRDFYADRFTGTDDNGGVHLNSGIANLAFYLLSQGGVHPRQKTTFTVPGITIDKAGAIFERALTKGYFTMNTTFAAARTATEQAAGELYGPAEVSAVSFAWAAVGIGDPPAADSKPPMVSITSPADGATVQPDFAIAVTATDDVGVLKVDLAIDGTKLGSDATAPYTFDATGLAAGAHTIEATAFDASNQAKASITVMVGSPTPPDAGPGSPDGGGSGTGSGSGNPGTGNPPGGCGCQSSSTSGGGPGAMLLFAAAWLTVRRRSRRAR